MEKVDCHADKSARNDRKTNAQAPKVDSSKNEQSNNCNPTTRRQDFGDKNGAFANAHKGVTFSGNDRRAREAIAVFSPKANAKN